MYVYFLCFKLVQTQKEKQMTNDFYAVGDIDGGQWQEKSLRSRCLFHNGFSANNSARNVLTGLRKVHSHQIPQHMCWKTEYGKWRNWTIQIESIILIWICKYKHHVFTYSYKQTYQNVMKKAKKKQKRFKWNWNISNELIYLNAKSIYTIYLISKYISWTLEKKTHTNEVNKFWKNQSKCNRIHKF